MAGVAFGRTLRILLGQEVFEGGGLHDATCGFLFDAHGIWRWILVS